MYRAGDRPDRAQTSPLSVLLIVSITITAAVVIVVFGGAALEGTQAESETGQAEQALTQFDSRASQVALGDSQSQNVDIGQQNGNYRVDEDAGAIRIYHENYTTDKTEYIYGSESEWVSLGAVVYEGENADIAYQGGGVWRSDDGGGSTMVSPPEFHYRQATLTFPLIRVNGTDTSAGRTSARVTRLETASSIFPQPGTTYPDGTEYLNPIQEGQMVVEIRSEYCEAWATYLRQRTDGEVTECNEDGVITAELVTQGTQGAFGINQGQELQVRGMDQSAHALQSLEFEFRSDSNSDFNNFGWSLSGENANGDRLELFVQGDGGGDVCKDNKDPEPVTAGVFYDDAENDTYNAWVIDESDPDAYHITCDDGEVVLNVDFLNASRNATYTTVSKSELERYDPPSGGLEGTEVMDSHSEDPSEDFVEGDELDIAMATQHYFALMGSADMKATEQQKAQGSSSAGLSEDSSGNIDYGPSDKVVTYLHITENRIRVELD